MSTKPTALTTTAKLPMPEQVIAGRYRILSRLGSGGMGLVFLAEQLGVGNKVALKFLDPEPSDDDSRIARFLREAKVGLTVQHPCATQVLDLGRDESMRLFVAFEFVEGQDLREVLRTEGRLRFGEARSIAIQIAQVLAFAHERGIVHRDVKPENVRVRRDLGHTHVKMLDFGIARLLKDSGVRLTAEGSLAGTPRYMSPEQVKDEPFDGRIDQYALGLVFFEMLTGAVAIGGRNVPQILMHQLQTLVPPLAWCDPDLAHADVDAFIARATAKEPGDRFPSMTAFIEALQALPVDEARWPAPRPPVGGPIGSNQPTRDDNPAGPPASSGLSDTFIRHPVQTELERRVEVPTDPWRPPVERRPDPEPKTEPMTPAVKRTEPTTEPPHLEMPTDPERPMVARAKPAKEPIRQTVRGEVTAPATPGGGRGWVIALVLALAALALAGLWWWRR